METKALSERWERIGKVMRPEDRQYALQLANFAKRHSPEVFYGFDDPLEGAMFSVLVEMLKMIDTVTSSPEQATRNRIEVDYA